MVNLSIGSYIRVAAIAMLNIPMEVLLSTARMRVGKPDITIRINIATAPNSGRVFQAIVTFRRHKRMPSAARKKPPWVFYRPVISLAHKAALTVSGTIQTAIVRGAGSRATKPGPSACRKAISSVAMATNASVSATTSGLSPKRSRT